MADALSPRDFRHRQRLTEKRRSCALEVLG
jgi:hypothetical protein